MEKISKEIKDQMVIAIQVLLLYGWYRETHPISPVANTNRQGFLEFLKTEPICSVPWIKPTVDKIIISLEEPVAELPAAKTI